MWSINSIIVPAGFSSGIYGGSGPAVGTRSVGDQFGPAGAVYFIAVQGLGTLLLEDVGASPSGSGWAVRLNGSNSYWTYQGQGQASISVDINGGVTITGGSGPASGKLITNMVDTGVLAKKMFQMVAGAHALQPAWNADAMAAMYQMGFPRTSMYNMDADCCRQFIALVRALQFPQQLQGAPVHALTVGASWFGCAACKAGYTGLIAALAAMIGAIIIATGGGAAGLAALEGAGAVVVIAEATGLATATIARLAATAFATAGAGSFVGSFVELLCKEGEYCD